MWWIKVGGQLTPCVTAMCTGLSPVTSRESSILQWQVGLLEPLVRMEGGDGLLRRGNEVFVILGWAVGDLVQLVVELFQLRSLGHHILQHELRRLQRRVAPTVQELQAVVDERLVEEGAPVLEEVASVAHDLDAALRFVPVYPGQYLVVGQAVLLLDRVPLGSPCADHLVVVLVHGDRYRVVDNVAHRVELGLPLGLLDDRLGQEVLVRLLKRGFLLEELIGTFLGLYKRCVVSARKLSSSRESNWTGNCSWRTFFF